MPGLWQSSRLRFAAPWHARLRFAAIVFAQKAFPSLLIVLEFAKGVFLILKNRDFKSPMGRNLVTGKTIKIVAKNFL